METNTNTAPTQEQTEQAILNGEGSLIMETVSNANPLTSLERIALNVAAYREANGEAHNIRQLIGNDVWNIYFDDITAHKTELDAKIGKNGEWNEFKQLASAVKKCFDNQDHAIVVAGMEKGLAWETIAKNFRAIQNKANAVPKSAVEQQKKLTAKMAEISGKTEAGLRTLAFTMPEAFSVLKERAIAALAMSTIEDVEMQVINGLETLKERAPEAFAAILAEFIPAKGTEEYQKLVA